MKYLTVQLNNISLTHTIHIINIELVNKKTIISVNHVFGNSKDFMKYIGYM